MPDPCPLTGPPRDTLRGGGGSMGGSGGFPEDTERFYSDLWPHPHPAAFWSFSKEPVSNREGLSRCPRPTPSKGMRSGCTIRATVLSVSHWGKPERKSLPHFQTSQRSCIDFLQQSWGFSQLYTRSSLSSPTLVWCPPGTEVTRSTSKEEDTESAHILMTCFHGERIIHGIW